MQSGFAVLKPTNSTSNYASLPPKNELPDPIHQSSQGVSQFVLIARDAMPQFLGLSVLAVLSVPWLTGLRLTTPLLRPKRPNVVEAMNLFQEQKQIFLSRWTSES